MQEKLNTTRQMLASHFILQLKRTGINASIASQEEITPDFLVSHGFDGIIELNFSDMSLRRAKGIPENGMLLYISVVGSMRRAPKGEVIWQRIETFVSSQPHTLGAYMAEDGKLLRQDIDTGLMHIALRMVGRGFIYLDE